MEKNIKNIDWSDFPCEKCSCYYESDDCICGELDKWSERQQLSEKSKEKSPKSLYENIVIVRDFVERMKSAESYDKELVDALMDVVIYADDCYVDHCEEIGKIAIEDIERMEEEWREEASAVDEEKLDKLAKEYSKEIPFKAASTVESEKYWAYKAGYYKAKEEIKNLFNYD